MTIYPFKQNKYTKRYISFISKRKDRIIEENVYYEKHHIVPKTANGSNDDKNLIKLTLREHYFAHLLLTKMFNDKIITRKMLFALSAFRMINEDRKTSYSFTSHQYHVLREAHYKSIEKCHPMKGKKHKDATKIKIGKSNRGRKRSDEFKKNRSKYMKIHENNPFFGRNVSGEKNPMYGKKGEDHPSFGIKRTNEEKEKISKTHKGIPKSEAHKNKLSKSARKRTGKKYYNNGIKSILLGVDDIVPEGFVGGRLNKMKWYTNGNDNKLLPINGTIPSDYYPGMSIKK